VKDEEAVLKYKQALNLNKIMILFTNKYNAQKRTESSADDSSPQNNRQFINMFHFLANQSFPLMDMEAAINILLSEESLLRFNSLNQVSSTGLTAFEMAVQTSNR